MQMGNRFRCYPTPAQAKTLLGWIGCQRAIYNAKCAEDRYFRSFARKSLTHAGEFAPIDQQYSQFKTELTPWLSDVPSQILRNGVYKWKGAYSRYFAKLAGRPTIQKKTGTQSVMITSELFEFKALVDAHSGEITGYQIHIGTKKCPVGLLDVRAHHSFKPPASIAISINAGRWHLSFNYDDGVPQPSEAQTTEWLQQFEPHELREMTVGLDRGVALPLATSDGQKFDFTSTQDKRLTDQEKHKKRWQRRQARRVKGSGRWVKAKRKVARYQLYGTDVRRDVAHKISHTLATDPRFQLFVFEALKVVNMTKRAKAKKDENGKWLRNGAAAKSGLNKAILASTWGQTKTYLTYKACRQGKLVIEVPAHYSSQECAACGHISPDNRISQSEFVCQSCHHIDHADHNAGCVIAARGVAQLLSGKVVKKEKKRVGIRKHKVGAVSSKPAAETLQPTLGETMVSRAAGNSAALMSVNRETPAIALA
jgi:putative transposase